MAAVNIHHSGELDRLQERQRAAVERSISRKSEYGRELAAGANAYPSPPSSAAIHPDLQDLTFGRLGDSHRYVVPGALKAYLRFLHSNLPPPLRPDAPESDDEYNAHGSLSDFSDYTSDEEAHNNHNSKRAGPSSYASAAPTSAAGTSLVPLPHTSIT